MTSNSTLSTPLGRPSTVEKPTPPILLSYSSKGSQQWIRKVEEEFTPRVGMEFDTLEDGIQFYQIYAIACGFDARRSSQRRFRDQSIRTKFVVCHREGFGESKKLKKMVNKESHGTPNKKERVTTIRRFGCTIMIKLAFTSGKYVISQFREGHNHPLVLVKNREFQKLSRNLTLYHKQTIINHSKINIGTSKTYRICKEVANGYENVGASLLDFKNFQREVKLFIGDADAEMFISFQYAYHVDEGRNLCRVFWTDTHGKSAYLVFGDGVSFDPTYGTNKYCMVFTPFTGIDNHKKSVTFASTLLSNEDEESFVWVFQKFMDAMGGKEPQLIITDQDPAIRNAVPTVFKTARHRFCMWLSTMFDIKEYWIPAYFRDMHMGNIMSTTQRSESENNFFKKFESHYGTLVEFWLRYESAMDQQRHTHKRLEMESNNSVPKTITPLSMESHALTLYTHEVFKEIQEEIKSSMCGCGIVGYSRNEIFEMTVIEDSQRSKTFAVQYNPLTSDVICNCKLFERRGIKCRHIFWVFSNKLLKTIPDKYILTRWSKNALRGPIYDLHGNIIENYETADVSQLEISKKEADVLRDLQRVLREFKDTVELKKERMSKWKEMEMLIGCSTPDEVRIVPPRQSKNKGSEKWIMTSKNKAIEKAKKPKRRCGNCKRMAYHDSRNCPEPFSKHPPDEDESSDSERN
ncbi:hypothetical protein RND81_05G064900 [Saponaria officinalis]|uniref:SWIM-type domain-containing protein n=1 Tax=Saponaria officinalis TaxID=3572 RepID=A0AAW1KV42_SAPOF